MSNIHCCIQGLEFDDKDKDLRSKTRIRTSKLVLEDKDKNFPRGQQNWVTVKNGLLADMYQ